MSSEKKEDLVLPKNAGELEQVLVAMTQPNTEIVSKATAVLNAFLKQAEAVQPMMQQIVSSSKLEARQMAAVLLRKHIGKIWKGVPENTQNEIKAALLQRLVSEPGRPVRKAIAGLIAALAQRLIPENKWNDLLEYLLKMCRSEDKDHRQLAMLLFRALAEDIGAHLKPHFKTLQGIFLNGLNDPDQSVRIEAVYAIGALIPLVDSDQTLAGFRQVIDPLIQLCKFFVSKSDDEIVGAVFEVFELFAETPLDILGGHIPNLTQLMIQVVSNKELDMMIREKGSLFLESLLESKPAKLVKLQLVMPIFECALKLMMMPNEDEGADGKSSQTIGIDILDPLLENIPKKVIFEHSYKTFLNLTKSANKYERKAGFLAFAVACDGCGNELLDHLETLVPLFCQGTKDPEVIVRRAAAGALTQFSDRMQEHMVPYHSQVIPVLMNILDNPNESTQVKEQACDALEEFCENLAEDVAQYSNQLMQKLLTMLTSSPMNVQKSIIACISSIAMALGEKFLPYFNATTPMLTKLISATGEQFEGLRAKATECMGSIAAAVGKEQFKPLLIETSKQVIAGMGMDSFTLREAGHRYFTKLVVCLEKDFDPFLVTVMPLVIGSLLSDDGVKFSLRSKAFEDDEAEDEADGPLQISEEDYPTDSDEEDTDDIQRMVDFSIYTGAIDEKVAAMAFLTNALAYIGEPFAKCLEKIFPPVDEMIEYPHPSIRHAALNVLKHMLLFCGEVYPNPQGVTKGQANPLHENAKFWADKIMPILVERMAEDSDRECCAMICEAISEGAKVFGLALVKDYSKDLFKATMTLLQEKAICQRPQDDDDDDLKDHDEILLDAVTDWVAIWASVCGASFEPAFRSMIPPLIKFCDPKRPTYDRSMAIGCFAEVADEMEGNAIAPHVAKLFPYALKGLSDASVAVRRNAAFCTGSFFLRGGKEALPFVKQALTSLAPLLDRNAFPVVPGEVDEWPACKDNAISAYCKAITLAMQQNASDFPLDQVLKAVVANIPLADDLNEAPHVYGTIINLYQKNFNAIINYTPQVLLAFSQVFGNPDIDTKLQQQWMSFCKQLLQQLGPQGQEILSKMPQERRDALLKYLNAAK